jgi:hypothetical protein
MEVYKKFELIKFSEKEIAIAKNHALARTKHIIRQFVPRAAPSNPIESNYGGVLGELAIRKFLKNGMCEDNNKRFYLESLFLRLEELIK